MDVDVKGMSDEVKARIEELGGIWRALCSVIPELETAAHVVRTSTSSGLRNVQTGEQYPGSGGFHDAVVIADAADIPRFCPTSMTAYGSAVLAGAGFQRRDHFLRER